MFRGSVGTQAQGKPGAFTLQKTQWPCTAFLCSLQALLPEAQHRHQQAILARAWQMQAAGDPHILDYLCAFKNSINVLDFGTSLRAEQFLRHGNSRRCLMQ